MVKEEYKQNIYKKFRYKRKTLKLFLKQIEFFEETEKNLKLPTHTYKIGDDVFLKKGTFMHGTRNNIDSLPLIMENGFLSNNVFNPNTRAQKTPYAVSMWNIQEDILLKDYIYLYSGMTIRYTDNKDQPTTKLVPYQQLDQEIENSRKENYWMWTAEQTKEIRFLPSLIRDDVQLAFILNMDNSYAQKLIKQDIFNLNNTFFKCFGIILVIMIAKRSRHILANALELRKLRYLTIKSLNCGKSFFLKK